MNNKEIFWDTAALLLSRGEHVKIKLSGFSMYPYLKPDYYGIVKNVAFDDISKGDVIAFSENEKYVLHRVMEKNSDFLICKGDSRMIYDAKVKPENVLGRLSMIEINSKLIDVNSKKHKLIASLVVRFPRFFCLKARIYLKIRSFFGSN